MHISAVRYFLVFVVLAIFSSCAPPTGASIKAIPTTPGGATPTPTPPIDTNGLMKITTSTTLTGNHTGQISLDADNITLDCANHKVSFTQVDTTGCGVTGNFRCGIRVENRTGFTIKNCEVTGAYDYGVWINGTSTPSLLETITASSNVIGFRIENSDKLTIRNSSATNGKGNGYSIRSSSHLTMSAVSAINNKTDGIDINDSSYVTIQQAQIQGNGFNGIEADGGPHATVENSVISHNGKHGFSFDPSELDLVNYPCNAFSFTGNVIEFNKGDGIRLQSCESGFIQNNTVQSNGGCNADQDRFSTGNTWTGNILQNWCGTVLDAH